MKALTTHLPIVARLNIGTSEALQYKSYSVGIKYFNYNSNLVDTKNLYVGKTLVGIDGYTSIHLEELLRDYLWRWRPAMDGDTQAYAPSHVMAYNAAYSVEVYSSSFWTAKVIVTCGSQSKEMLVTGGWTPTWCEDMDYIDPVGGSGLQSYCRWVPHVPLVSTSVYWVGAVLNVAIPTRTVTLRIGNNAAQTFVTRGGTVAAAWTLANIIANYTFGNKRDLNVTAGDTKATLAIFDDCPAPYYASWITPEGGWMSYGFNGCHAVKSVLERNAITNLDNEHEVVSVSGRQSFNLSTGYVSEEEYAMLTTIAASRICYVYDTARDKGFYCTPALNETATLDDPCAAEYFNIILDKINPEEI